ncbi:MAG TPA: thiolase [Streptomyces sp.]|nr:thiolase [Streptomyces sp.]
MSTDLRGRVAAVGVAEAGVGEVGPGLTPLDLLGRAAHAAVTEAGLGIHDVDGLFTASSTHPAAPLDTAEYLGIRPRYMDGTLVGGSSFVSHLLHAATAIEAGLCEVALIAYGSTQRSAAGKLVARTRLNPYEAPYRPRFPVTMYALAASRHMHRFGTTREQLAEVAVAARAWAGLNPHAWARDPLTVEDVLNSRPVSSPLRVLDCCLVTDGAGAVVLTSAERARDLPRKPVYLLGAAEATTHQNISQMPDLTTTAAAVSGPRAFAAAGLTPADVDVVQLYDAFTINTLLFLEDLGFCPKGEGGAFVSGGRIAPGGELAVNTNGGGLSYCHPGMNGIFLMIEAIRQVRGECGARQRPDVEVALAHGSGGVLSSQVTAVFGAESTL